MPSVSVTSIETARGEVRINYDYSAAGTAEVNTNIFEAGNSQNATDLFRDVSGDGSATERLAFNQGQSESVTWEVTVLIEENGSFDQQQFSVTVNPDGSGTTTANVPISRVGDNGNGDDNGPVAGLSTAEIAALGAAALGVGLAVVRTRNR